MCKTGSTAELPQPWGKSSRTWGKGSRTWGKGSAAAAIFLVNEPSLFSGTSQRNTVNKKNTVQTRQTWYKPDEHGPNQMNMVRNERGPRPETPGERGLLSGPWLLLHNSQNHTNLYTQEPPIQHTSTLSQSPLNLLLLLPMFFQCSANALPMFFQGSVKAFSTFSQCLGNVSDSHNL